MATDFAVVYEQCRTNVLPAMLESLAGQLGVSAEALDALGYSWDLQENCWLSPERDAEGKVIGLVRRSASGGKWSIPGSKRGLSYVLSRDYLPGKKAYSAGKQNWVRTSPDVPCPICGKHDWCLVSAENPHDPQAVLCGRCKEGSGGCWLLTHT